jgi:cysteine sulfinate desulfinase/cysteine desulfurase-like protein
LGGAQENDKRAGTEAMPSIAGLGEAARLAYRSGKRPRRRYWRSAI